MPDLEQVLDLPRLLQTTVDREHEDANGHLNVTGHMALYNQAGWPWLAELDLDPSVSGGRHGMMDLEHHLRFLGEVFAHDVVAVHARLLARDRNRLHATWYLADLTHAEVAGMLEFVSVHVDLERRESIDFPAIVAGKLDAQIAAQRRSWDPPVCGVMGL